MTTNSGEIKDQVTQAMKEAMRTKDKVRLGVIRLIQAAFKQIEVDERITIDDLRALAILDKMIKQRRESIQQYEKANRGDLVEQEANEIKVLQEFMPEPLTMAEITDAVDTAIQQSGAINVRDIAKVMEILRPKVQGKADMGLVSSMVKEQLNTN